MKKNVFEKMLSVFAWFAFILSFLTAAIAVFSSMSGEKNGKEFLGYKFLIVASDSMSKSPISENEPIFFESGDLIIIKSTDINTVFKEGDVISFISYNSDSYGKTLTHKIREVKYSAGGQLVGYVTYGIHTGTNDQTIVQPETILGLYVRKIPNAGHIFAFLKTPQGYYLSILIPTVLLIMFFSVNVGKYYGRKEALAEQVSEGELAQIKRRLQALEEGSAIALTQLAVSTERAPPTEEQIETIQTQDTGVEVTVEEPSNTPEIEPIINIDVDKQEEKDDTPAVFSMKRGKKIAFIEKLSGLDERTQGYYNDLNAEILSYKKVRGRVSFKGVSYYYGRNLLAKITVRGKTLTAHFPLDITQFNQNTYFQKDMSEIKAYEDVPFAVKVKSDRGYKNAAKLVACVMQEKQIEKSPLPLAVQEDPLPMEDVDVAVQKEEHELSRLFAKKIRIKVSFNEKLATLDSTVQEYYNSLNHELLSYKKVQERVSFKGVSYRIGRKLLAKITIRGKTLTAHFALDISQFNQNVYFQKDMSEMKAYQDVPFTVKVKSARAHKNALKLIESLMQVHVVEKK